MLLILCDRCRRKVRVPPDEVGVWTRPDGCNLFRFTCPRCGLPAGGCVETEGLDALKSAGVPVTVLPAEATERRSGPALSWDDLIDFHFLLESGDWWNRLLDPARGAAPETGTAEGQPKRARR